MDKESGGERRVNAPAFIVGIQPDGVATVDSTDQLTSHTIIRFLDGHGLLSIMLWLQAGRRTAYNIYKHCRPSCKRAGSYGLLPRLCKTIVMVVY